MKLLFVLQNAWRKGAQDGDSRWEDRLWRWGLAHSQTGRRLREMTPEGCKVISCNASPRVGNHSGSLYPPDRDYVAEKVFEHEPDIVILCGRQAQLLHDEIQLLWPALPLVKAPHPTWRQLTKEMTAQIRKLLERLMAELDETYA